MKITPAHFAQLQSLIEPLDTIERRAEYKAKGLTDKRYRWDLTYFSGNANNSESCTRFICDTLYSYMNDSHVDTALRSIVKPL
jgi:hypothetical protein